MKGPVVPPADRGRPDRKFRPLRKRSRHHAAHEGGVYDRLLYVHLARKSARESQPKLQQLPPQQLLLRLRLNVVWRRLGPKWKRPNAEFPQETHEHLKKKPAPGSLLMRES